MQEILTKKLEEGQQKTGKVVQCLKNTKWPKLTHSWQIVRHFQRVFF